MSQEPVPPPFVGRTTEVQALESALEQASSGAGRVVFVVGEPGIGKTALLSEFLRRARQRLDPPLTLCRGRCTEQYGTGEAYLAFLDGMGRLLGGRGGQRFRQLLRTFAPTWCLQFPSIFEGDVEALQRQTVGASKERMLREMGELFDTASREYPMAVIGEDFQWADPSSVDLLRYLAARLPRQRLLIVITLRDANLDRTNPVMHRALVDLRAHVQELRLGLLPASAVASYLALAFSPHLFPETFTALLAQRTEGHPLFLQSLVQFLRDRGDIAWDGKAWVLSRPLSDADVPAPENVRDMIRRTFETLTGDDRTTLQHASVLGREFNSAVLASFLQTDVIGLEERLSALARTHHLLSPLAEEELPDGTLALRYRFVHSLYPETLYGDLVTTKRHGLHKQAAQALAARYGEGAIRHATALAVHFERGRDFASAILWRQRAADNARERHAYAEALDHCDRAGALLERLEGPERTRTSLLLLEQRGAVNHALGRFDLAIRDYTLMRERARSARAADRETDALVGLANALFFARRPEEMAVRAHEALITAVQSASPPRLAAARLAVALLLQDTGDLQNAEALLRPLVAEAQRLGLKSVLMGALLQRGTLHYWRSEYAESEARLKEALALATELGDGFIALCALFFIGNAQVNLGRIGEGRRYLEEGIALARRNGHSYWLARLLGQMGWLHRELQDFERANAYDYQSVVVAREAGARWAPEPDALLSLFLDAARSGEISQDAKDARMLFEQASSERALLGWFFEIRKENGLAEYALSQGQAADLREHANRLLQAASDKGTPTYGITAHKLLADAALLEGRTDEALASLATAMDLLRVHACPLIAWRTLATLGRTHLRRGAPAEARGAFAEAAALVRRIAATDDEPTLPQRFLASPAVQEILRGERA